jgi:hypothetical protein
MAVAYIGDREVGKTHLALELTNPESKYVKVTHPEHNVLKSLLYNQSQGRTVPTKDAINIRQLNLQVQLPSGRKKLALDWMDSSGENWRESWQYENPEAWTLFLKTLQQSEGVLLVLSPYREMITVDNPEDFITKQQWCNRFEMWTEFFKGQCPKLRHLLLCLNKADLFCDIAKEGQLLSYSPNGSELNWQQRNDYVFKQYFKPIKQQILDLNKNTDIDSVRYFITSIKDRNLLELPWIYLGTYLGY